MGTWALAGCYLTGIGGLIDVTEREIELEVALRSLSFVVRHKRRVNVA